ncbi:MAG TPA: SRPBCC family protein [Acidimicrobiia bacterium]
MAGQQFRGSAVTTAELDSVWGQFDDPRSWEGIPGVDRVYDAVRDEGGQLVGFTFDSTAVGRTYVGTATPGPREHGKSLIWEIKTSEIGGRLSVTTEIVPGGCRIDVLLDVAPVSMMASLAFPLIAGTISNGFQETIDDFAEALTR